MVHILTNEASLTGGDRMFEIWQLRAYHPNCHVYWDWSDGQTWCPNIPYVTKSHCPLICFKLDQSWWLSAGLLSWDGCRHVVSTNTNTQIRTWTQNDKDLLQIKSCVCWNILYINLVTNKCLLVNTWWWS